MRVLRVADAAAAVAAIVLAVLMFGPWYRIADGSGSGWSTYGPLHVTSSGWSSLGWAADVLIALAIAGGLAVFAVIALARPQSAQVVTTVGATVAALASLIVVAIRLLSPPGLGVGGPSPAIDIRLDAYLGLGALAVLLAACWRSMADERTDARGAAYDPPPARPAPPA